MAKIAKMSTANNEVNTYFGKCRCCLNYGYLKNMWEEHYWDGGTEIYVEMLVQCFALSWEHSDESMQHDQICETCIKRLRDAHEFKKVILDSQEELLRHVDVISVVGTVESSTSNTEGQNEKKSKTTTISVIDTVESSTPNVEDQKEGKATTTKTGMQIKTESEWKDEIEKLDDCDSDGDDNMYIDDPDDPNYVDPNDPTDGKDPVDPQDPNMEYEEVEYLEDEDSLAGQNPEPTRVRSKTPTQTKPENKWPQRLPKTLRYKTYKQYTEEDLRKCIETVRNREMSCNKAALKYNIPVKTIIAKSKLGPKDVQNDNTTGRLRSKPTILRENKLKTKRIKKFVPKTIKSETSVKEDVLIDIKKEIGAPIDAVQVRNKYKAIVDAKFKKESLELDKSDANEMNKHKDNIKHVLESSNATLIKGFWGNGYSCCFCDEQKENPNELKSHNLNLHSKMAEKAIRVKYVSDLVLRLDITGLKCTLCNQKIDSLELLTEHLSKKHSKVIHKDVKNHMIPFKFDSESLQCIVCRKEFKYFKLLSEHMSQHYRNYECPICDRTFINKQSMQSHSYRHKSGLFQCSHCPKVFDTRPKRSVHERVTHTLSNKTRKCSYCDEKFATKDLVQNHEAKIHGAKLPEYNCQACNKSYTSESSLVTHRKRYHLMLRPHKCSYCDMAFFSRVELRSHTVTHTKSREFKCEICGKCFGTRCGLNQHIRGHLDDRRFKCDICERTFVHRTAFRVHMRSKHGKIV